MRAIQALKGKLAYANPWKSWEGLTLYFEPKWNYREGVIPYPIQIFPGPGYTPNWKPFFYPDKPEPIFNHTFTIKYNPAITNFDKIFEDWGTMNLPEELDDYEGNIKLEDIVNYLKSREGVIDVRIN